MAGLLPFDFGSCVVSPASALRLGSCVGSSASALRLWQLSWLASFCPSTWQFCLTWSATEKCPKMLILQTAYTYTFFYISSQWWIYISPPHRSFTPGSSSKSHRRCLFFPCLSNITSAHRLLIFFSGKLHRHSHAHSFVHPEYLSHSHNVIKFWAWNTTVHHWVSALLSLFQSLCIFARIWWRLWAICSSTPSTFLPFRRALYSTTKLAEKKWREWGICGCLPTIQRHVFRRVQ